MKIKQTRFSESIWFQYLPNWVGELDLLKDNSSDGYISIFATGKENDKMFYISIPIESIEKKYKKIIEENYSSISKEILGYIHYK